MYSYLLPVRIRRSSSTLNPLLDLLFFRGRFQLATADALYSDGHKYRPMRIAFRHLRTELGKKEKVLVLGTGLGSAVLVMEKMGYRPQFTLVEHDETVLKWALETLPHHTDHIHPVCMDAQTFMANNTEQYDLVIADVFNSRIVPDFVTTAAFLQQCRDCLRPGGHFVLNYIVQQNEDWQRVDSQVRAIFPRAFCTDDNLNRIVVATF